MIGLESSEILNDPELESLYGMLPFNSANLLYRATRDGKDYDIWLFNLRWNSSAF